METPREELDIISYLSNPIVRSNVRGIAKRLKPLSSLGKSLLTYYMSLNTGYTPEDGAMEAYLKSKKFTDAEIGFVIAKKLSFATISKEGSNELIKAFFDYYTGVKILDAIETFQKDQVQDYQAAKKELLDTISNVNSISGSLFELINLAEEDIDKIIEDEIAGEQALIPSKYEVVRASSAFGKYSKGWIVEVCGKPGVGKTMFLFNEIINMARQGFNTVWAALGDTKKSTCLLRVATVVSGATLDEVVKDPKKYITKEVLDIFSHIRFLIYSAGEITANELVNNILGIDPLEFDYQVVVIDYDDNLAEEYDNMYKEGGNTYREFTRLSIKKDDLKLVFAASQINKEFWDIECLPEKCVAQSSAKQARVDMMICINTNSSKSNIGTINIPKQRFGSQKKCLYKLEPNGNIKTLLQAEYDEIKNGR